MSENEIQDHSHEWRISIFHDWWKVVKREPTNQLQRVMLAA